MTDDEPVILIELRRKTSLSAGARNRGSVMKLLPHEIEPGRGHQSRKLFDESEWFIDHVRGAIAPAQTSRREMPAHSPSSKGNRSRVFSRNSVKPPAAIRIVDVSAS